MTARSLIAPGKGFSDSVCGVNSSIVTRFCRRILTLDYYEEEVSGLVDKLNLTTSGYELFGHSFGTIHAIKFAARNPKGTFFQIVNQM